jgi:hypothetical protein
VEQVRNTEIFARSISNGRQVIIYSMELMANDDLAMILPVPVAQPAAEDAVEFVSLSDSPDLFAELRRGFPPRFTRDAASLGRSAGRQAPPLKVVQVGSFNASFVPAGKDFGRLDPQFRLPGEVWEKLGAYSRYGFAVFKLRKGRAHIHPMAFVFRSALPHDLFFPTVHIHDGTVDRRADFDHALYCQVERRGVRSLMHWEESTLPAGRLLKTQKTRDLILPDQHVFRRTMSGEFPNEDVLLKLA